MEDSILAAYMPTQVYSCHGRVVLDCLKTSKQSISVVQRNTADVLYTIDSDEARGAKTIRFRRGDAAQPAYATLTAGQLDMVDPYDLSLIKRLQAKEFLSEHASKASKKTTRGFSVQGLEYRLKTKGMFGSSVELIPADARNAPILASFSSKDALFSDSTKRAEIVIYPAALSAGSRVAAHALLHHGQPTYLLDLALVAELLLCRPKKESPTPGQTEVTTPPDYADAF